MQTLAQRVGRAIGDHLKFMDDLEAEERDEAGAVEALQDIAATVARVLGSGKGSAYDAAVTAGYDRYTHVPRERGAAVEA